MFFIGIDPGLTGAITILNENGTLSGILDLTSTSQITKRLSRLDSGICLIEQQKVFAGDTDGGKFHNIVKLFESYGFCKGLLANYPNISVSEVLPQTWQMHFYNKRLFPNLTNKKHRSLVICEELALDEPDLKSVINLKKHHNRADSYLIAQYCFFNNLKNN